MSPPLKLHICCITLLPMTSMCVLLLCIYFYFRKKTIPLQILKNRNIPKPICRSSLVGGFRGLLPSPPFSNPEYFGVNCKVSISWTRW